MSAELRQSPGNPGSVLRQSEARLSPRPAHHTARLVGAARGQYTASSLNLQIFRDSLVLSCDMIGPSKSRPRVAASAHSKRGTCWVCALRSRGDRASGSAAPVVSPRGKVATSVREHPHVCDTKTDADSAGPRQHLPSGSGPCTPARAPNVVAKRSDWLMLLCFRPGGDALVQTAQREDSSGCAPWLAITWWRTTRMVRI